MSITTMDPNKRFDICSKGGKAAHASGNAHEFTSEEAREAGALGGKAVLAKRGSEYYAEIGRKGGISVSQNREHMQEIGRKGGIKVAKIPGRMRELGRKGGSARSS